MPDLVRVLSTPSIIEGEIVKSRLEDEGIPVLLKGGGNDPYGVGAAHVFVPADYEVQARLVLESANPRVGESARDETTGPSEDRSDG